MRLRQRPRPGRPWAVRGRPPLIKTDATDGRQNLAGFVFAEVLFAPSRTKVPAALLWHGSVKTAKLPVTVTPVAPSAICQIRFV
ncbi:hypothetical protein ACFV2H_51700 [Streptomyces sp. NPDC059629]|uniref:hypothetical protein n=1 Tax=Streptomyces sp. NPDC059629 TaxID=3346889 RepID=UPI0036759C45